MYKHHLLFGRKNYMFMLIGIGVILLGYLLMSGGASTDPNVYPEDVIYGFQRTILGPIVCLIGFGIEIAAIFWRNEEEMVYQAPKETPLSVAPKTTSTNAPLKPIAPSPDNMPKKK
jgi:hypothetical protein